MPKCNMCVLVDHWALKIDTIISRKDCAVNYVKQTENGLLTSIELEFPKHRDIDYPDITYTQIDKNTFACTVKRVLGADKTAAPFVFSDIINCLTADNGWKISPELDFSLLIGEIFRLIEKFQHHVLNKVITFRFRKIVQPADIFDNGSITAVKFIPVNFITVLYFFKKSFAGRGIVHRYRFPAHRQNRRFIDITSV